MFVEPLSPNSPFLSASTLLTTIRPSLISAPELISSVRREWGLLTDSDTVTVRLCRATQGRPSTEAMELQAPEPRACKLSMAADQEAHGRNRQRMWRISRSALHCRTHGC